MSRKTDICAYYVILIRVKNIKGLILIKWMYYFEIFWLELSELYNYVYIFRYS